MAKVYVIITGGTISMLDVNSVEQDSKTTFEGKIRKILPQGADYPEVDFKVYSPLIDSSEMNVELYNAIGQDIHDKYHEYDGFVILHGTDTMAYTSAALSFMLGNLGKPVILTGAQTPLSESINDARENIITSIYLASSKDINEVCICFNRTIFRGNRVTKYSTNDYDAYQSPNYTELGKIQSTIELNNSALLPAPANSVLTLNKFEECSIRIIKIHPILTPKDLSDMIQGANAIILESFGDGNIKMKDPRYLQIIVAEREKGVIFINKSQCMRSNTVPKYDAGDKLEQAGIVSAGDQTIEALIAKLTYFMSKKLTPTQVESAMKVNLCGELTPMKAEQKQKHYGFRSDQNPVVFFQQQQKAPAPGFGSTVVSMRRSGTGSGE